MEVGEEDFGFVGERLSPADDTWAGLIVVGRGFCWGSSCFYDEQPAGGLRSHDGALPFVAFLEVFDVAIGVVLTEGWFFW